MFLKLRLSASNREMVVWLKSFPYSLPIATPTSPWQRQINSVRNETENPYTHTQTSTCTNTRTPPALIFVFYLGESQLDASLFEGAGKLLQLLQVAGLFPHVTPVTSCSHAGRQRGSHGTAGRRGSSYRRHNANTAAAGGNYRAAAASTDPGITALLPLW